MAGVVEEVEAGIATLRDFPGNVYVVLNGIVDKVKTMTKGYSYYLFVVGVAYRRNFDEVMAVLKDIAEDVRGDPAFNTDILETLDMLGVDQFADSAFVIKCRIKTNPM